MLELPGAPSGAAPLTRKSIAWTGLAGLACAAAAIGWFLATDAALFLRYTPEGYTDYFWPRRAGLVPHIAGGALALLAGLVQLWLGLAGRTGALHRWVGRVYLSGVLSGSLAALYLVATIPPAMALYRAGLVGLIGAWLVTTVTAWRAIRRRDVPAHRLWMVRSFIVTFAFVSLRAIVKGLLATGLMTEEAANVPAAWLCWIVPLAVFEVVLRARRRA